MLYPQDNVKTIAITMVEPRKAGVMAIILCVSLFAVSFPGLSKYTAYVRIPGVVFFIGKHFGTGVILATAFIHLLDDAFRSLQSKKVEERYGKVGKWTGSIILGSLLSIFLVEYVSTSYVEHLQDKPSAPPTPAASRPSSISPPKSKRSRTPIVKVNETTPLLVIPGVSTQGRPHHPVQRHHTLPIEVLTGSPRICRLAIAHVHSGHGHQQNPKYGCECSVERDDEPSEEGDEEPRSQQHPRVGRRRQVIGILVLQLGIMIHSLVIGLTLAVTSGSDFTSLTTAIVFHQLFEGLSLGIRIAALPPAPPKTDDDDWEELYEEPEERHPPLSAEATSAARSVGWRHKLARSIMRRLHRVQWLKPTMVVLFGLTTPVGMALGMILWDAKDGARRDEGQMLLIQGVMSAISAGLLIYAATVEMIAGDFVFGDVDGGHHHHHHHEHNDGHEQDHEHEHEHGHEQHDPVRETDGGSPASSSRAGRGELAADAQDASLSEPPPKKSGTRKRVLALASLFAGAAMMIVVGLGE